MRGIKTSVIIFNSVPYPSFNTNSLIACTKKIASVVMLQYTAVVSKINYDVHLSRLFYCRGVASFKASQLVSSIWVFKKNDSRR